MALPAVAWQVKATGNDLNGGGFTAGGSGTDYSRQDAAQLSVTDGTASGTTTLNSTTGGFTTAMADNVLQISGGTLTAGFYRIVSRTSANAVVLDRTPGTGSGSTVKVGGRFATIGQANTAMTVGDRVFAVGAFTTAATITLSKSQSPSNAAMYNCLIGGAAAAADGGNATITLATNTGLSALDLTGNAWQISNVAIDCASLSTSTGIKIESYYNTIRNCKISNFSFIGIYNTGYTYITVEDCEVTGGTSGSNSGVHTATGGNTVVRHCNVHNNLTTVSGGIIFADGGGGEACFNLVTNNSGVGLRGGGGDSFFNNTVYASGGDGIYVGSTNLTQFNCRNNLLVNNGGYGLDEVSAGWPALPMYDGNAYYNNTSGTRHNLDDTGGTNAINGVSPYTNTLDVILTADPFTNAAGGDFTLNNTAGGGKACRGAGTPGALPGVSQVGYLDIGALQHADPTPSVGQVRVPQNAGSY